MRDVLKGIAVFLAYFTTAKIGLALDPVGGFATLVWPPTGIAIASLFLFGYRFAPSIFLGAFFVNLSTGAPPAAAAGIGIGNMSEAVLAAYLLRRAGFDPALERMSDVLYLLLAAAASAVVSAVIGVASIALVGIIGASELGPAWSAWWTGGILGALIAGSFIFAWSAFRWRHTRLRNVAEAALATLVAVAVTTGIFGRVPPLQAFPLLYLIFPPVLWVALRLDQRATVTVIMLTTVSAIIGTAMHLGPFASPALRANLWNVQLFFVTLGATALLFAAQAAERRRARSALQESYTRINAIIGSIGHGIVVTDADGNVILVNRAFEEMLGWRADEVVGRNLLRTVPAEDQAGKPVRLTERVLSPSFTGEKFVASLQTPLCYFVRRDRTRFPVGIVATPVRRNGEFLGVVEVFSDITKEAAADRAKSEFMSLAAHQLRTPPTTIHWYTEMLLAEDNGRMSARQRDYLQEIYRSNRHMMDFINAILNVSRIELGTYAINPTPTDVAAIVRSTVQDFALPAQEKRITIKEEYEEGLAPLPADAKVLSVIVQNLVCNAVSYTAPEGSVAVRVARAGRRRFAGSDETGPRIPASWVVISVSDTGIGIPRDEQARVFSKLFRASNAKEIPARGTGLGLYIVKSVTNLVGGTAWFVSEESKGSSFFVAFPPEGMTSRGGKASPA